MFARSTVCTHDNFKLGDACFQCRTPEQMLTINIELLKPGVSRQIHQMIMREDVSYISTASGTHIYVLDHCKFIRIFGRSVEDLMKGRELLFDRFHNESPCSDPFRAVGTIGILGDAFLDSVKCVPYKGHLYSHNESSGKPCNLYVLDPVELSFESKLQAAVGIDPWWSMKLVSSLDFNKICSEGVNRIHKFVVDSDKAVDRVKHEIYFGKSLWYDRDPGNPLSTLENRAMGKEGFSRILNFNNNFNKEVHTAFRKEWDLRSINQFIAGIESYGYQKVGSVQRTFRITSICEGGAMEMIWTCKLGWGNKLEVIKFRTREANLFEATMINKSTAMDSKVTTRGIQKFETSPELVDLIVKSFAYIDHEITELPDRPNYFNNYKAEKVEMNTWILGNRKITIERFLSTSKKEHYTIKLSSLTLKKLARYIDHEGPETADHIKAAVLDLNRGAQHIHEMFTLKAEGLILRPKVAPKLAGAASHKEWLATMLRSPVYLTRRRRTV